ncbi:MAG: efflux RND transporter periplasmic adaptor subunit [Flavobacteriaceae bacterium]|nr:efflux RND transporter periplasmic adaptor subunit [Mangrovimonas sp.]MCB0427794.1 efflux RND transporter periplasmic adaptor subunit [Mangrovimonas sp.]MCB0432741.1 efflux RND transporter periplasmic adaptor subunit [Mangrovimonas sp.]MCB0436631.1 efflux RND transporter periplasmic adaptor subunit [Mangrovimonas sp.]HPF96254.1 efflux RND transporter periplasmic adaptor subunit [Mangrovimonas sp.]
MKNISILLIAGILLTSCGGEKKNSLENVLSSNNLELMRKKRAEIVSEQQAAHEKLVQLDEAIAKLDTIKKAPLITTFIAKQEDFNHYFEIQGNVTTKDLLVITPEFNGILTNVYVKEGQKVSKGQILAKIDDGGLSQQLAQLKIQADLAKTTYERQKRLWEQNIGSEIQYLQAKSNYEAQSKATSQMEQQLAKTTVRAPFSGTIDDVITEQGSVVSAGVSQLMRIVNLNNMYIETEVPERYVKDVIKGKHVKAEFPILGKTIETEIRQASDFINPSNRTFRVEVSIPKNDESIKPNLTAKLQINDYNNPKALLIPQSVISENAEGEQYVYTVVDKNDKNEGIAKKTIITTGKTQGDVIEVLSGLEDGTEIIKEGARSVKDSQTVEVIKFEEETKATN